MEHVQSIPSKFSLTASFDSLEPTLFSTQGSGELSFRARSLKDLVAYLLKTDYLALQEKYETCKDRKGRTFFITDLPTVITSLRVGTAKKTVLHYACAPRRLEQLEDEIDRVANTKRWIGNPPPSGPIPTLQAPLPTSLRPPES